MKKSTISMRRVLVLVKSSKFDYFNNEAVQSFHEHQGVKDILRDLEKSSIAHKKNVRLFSQLFKSYCANRFMVTFTKDFSRVSEAGLNQFDLVMTLGGDGTYLKTVALVGRPRVPIIGLNTDIVGSEGYLCSEHIDYREENNEQKFKDLFDRLQEGDFKNFERRRISMEVYDNVNQISRWEKYALNDVFFSNPEPGQLTGYRMQIDGGIFENFKSSGLLTATMTGSTAWLRNARKISRQSITQLLDLYHQNYLDGSSFVDREDRQAIIDQLQEDLRIDRTVDEEIRRNSVHYLVREKRTLKNGLSGNPDPYPTMGHVKEIKLINTSLRANISIDGMIGCDSEFGDTIRLAMAPHDYSISQICFDDRYNPTSKSTK